MAIVPNTLAAGAAIVAADLNANFSALETAITGNLTEASLSSSTRIPNSKIENNDFAFTVSMRVSAGDWIATDNVIQASCVIAYDATAAAETFTVLSVDMTSRNTSATTPDFTIEWGYVSAGAFTTAAGGGGTGVVICNTTALGSAAGLVTPSNITLANSSFSTNSAQVRCLAIVCDGAVTGLTTAGDFLEVFVKLKRELRS